MSEWFERRLTRKARQDDGRAAAVELAAIVAGCVGFAYWQQSTGAGWFMFAVLACLDDAASQIALAIYARKPEPPK